MNEVIAVVMGVAITPWKIIGYSGVFLFAGRWVVQVLATRKAGKPVVPRAFWGMSILGSALLLSYFIWGKNDSVGVLANLFPMSVALYNWFMDLRHSREPSAAENRARPMIVRRIVKASRPSRPAAAAHAHRAAREESAVAGRI